LIGLQHALGGLVVFGRDDGGVLPSGRAIHSARGVGRTTRLPSGRVRRLQRLLKACPAYAGSLNNRSTKRLAPGGVRPSR
jgi:hypothetical protein